METNLNNLSLKELKKLCKKYDIAISGTKKELISRINELHKPITVKVDSYKHLEDKKYKIKGVKINDHKKLIAMGKKVQENKAKFIFYSMGVQYFKINK